MPITLRNTKGSELTFAELDGNFTHLENEINTGTDSSTIKTFIDTTYVTGIVDQTYIEGIVDSAFVNARVNSLNSLDSAEAIQLIDSAYVQARQVDVFRDSGFVTDIIDSAYIIARQEDNQRSSTKYCKCSVSCVTIRNINQLTFNTRWNSCNCIWT